MESENKLIYGLGLSDLIIVQSNDATLIINQNEAEKVKNIVEELTKIIFLKAKITKNI